MTPQLSPGHPRPDPALLDLMRRLRALLIEAICLLLAGADPDDAPNAALIEATRLAVHQRALALIREWGTDRAWAIVASTEAAVMLEDAP